MRLARCLPVLAVLTTSCGGVAEQPWDGAPIPRTWDDAQIAQHEVPLANAAASPKHVTSDYYYRIPVRPIYKAYPVYAYGHAPPGYIEWLNEQEPVIVWDDRGHAPRLETESDWVAAGEIVFNAATALGTNVALDDVRDPTWLGRTGTPVASDGSLPWFQYVVRRTGVVELGLGSCAFCHTRLMPDGSILKGAQGNLPVQQAVAFRWRAGAASAPDQQQYLRQLRTFLKRLHAAPYLRPDPEDRIDAMSVEEIAALFESYPPSASPRHRGNSFIAIQVPDLIGVKERRYLDRTGLERQRDIGDLMRYAAMNQGADSLGSFAGFIPADAPRFSQLPPPESQSRYSDEQLYALALYVYSLKPPPNPNPFNALAERGKEVFEEERCGRCHTPPLYTNNKLTPAEGFEIPPEHHEIFDITRVSVGTDPTLTMSTRRGTGYYKVPSLRGLWYREMFPHDGSVATLEDWFDPARLRDDYVPTGFKGYGVERRAVRGHEFGLRLDAEDKRALIAFLKTL
jgi:hypothetical protein